MPERGIWVARMLTNADTWYGGESMVCDFGAAPPGAPSHWAVQVVIEHLETSRALAEELGAKVIALEIKVPSVGRMAFVIDPTGAMISLFEPDMSSAPAA